MEDINNFRIGYSALQGFFIENKKKAFQNVVEVNEKRSLFNFPKLEAKTVEVDYWEMFYHKCMPKDNNGEIGFFDDKDAAVEFIKAYVSEIEYYYPSEFNK